MRWVSYTRTTSGRRSDKSESGAIPLQNERIQAFMKECGWEVSKKYCDRKESETEVNYFSQMVQDGLKREFDGVVFDSIYRCGRNYWEALEILRKNFFPAGIHFAFAEDAFTSVGKTEEEVEDYFTRKCSETGREFALKNITRRAEEGKLNPMSIIYGLRGSDDGKAVEIDEEGAAVVRQIFQLFLDGKSCTEIAEILNQRGIATPHNHQKEQGIINYKKACAGSWYGSLVRKILHKEAYALGRITNEVEGKVYTWTFPPVISKEVFRAAREKFEKDPCSQVQKRKRIPETGLLKGRVFSKENGSRILCCRPPDQENVFYLLERRYYSPSIPYEKMVLVIRTALQTAVRQAGYIDRLLAGGEGEALMEAELAPLREQARAVFDRTAELYLQRSEYLNCLSSGQDLSPDVQEETVQQYFSEPEEEFQAIMDTADWIEKKYSRANPWLVLYRDIEVPEEIKHEHIMKWVDKVFVDKLLNIEVQLKRTEWMNGLPKEWLEKGAME